MSLIPSKLPPHTETGISYEKWLECRELELETWVLEARGAAKITQPENYAVMATAARHHRSAVRGRVDCHEGTKFTKQFNSLIR